MRVLLINTNRNRFLTPPPIGLAYLASALRAGRYDFRVLDLMFSRKPQEELKRVLDEYNPGVAGFSIRNLDNQSMLHSASPLPEIREFVSAAHEKGITSVLGGTAFTTMPGEMLEYMQADFGIAGQGEESLPDLLYCLETGNLDSNIPGLVWKDGGAMRMNPPRIHGYQEALSPDWDAIDVKRYHRSIWPVSVVVKSGCPYHCAYCDAHSTFGRHIHMRLPGCIVEEISRIVKDFGIRVFYLSDPCFKHYP